VRICTRYFAHGARLEEGVLLRDACRLAGIPGVLIHGRLDLGGPLDTAWELCALGRAHSWSSSRMPAIWAAMQTRDHVLDALNRFAAR